MNRDVVDKLLAVRTDEMSVLSVYLDVPRDPGRWRSLPARLDGLVTAAWGRAERHGARKPPDSERVWALRQVEARERDWSGRMVALFASQRAGLTEAVLLPCGVDSTGEQAVLARRPHIRPLLAALQRCPRFLVVVADRRRTRLLRIDDTEVEAVADVVGDAVRSPRFGGWYGLESRRVNERVSRLARQHFRDSAALLERYPDRVPFVVGGHEDSIPRFLAAVSAAARDRFAGSFVVDPHTMTLGQARALGSSVIGRWVGSREREVGQTLAAGPPTKYATGLDACLAAANSRAIDLLAVPDGGLEPGFECGECGMLGTSDACPVHPGSGRWIPDLLEELVGRILDESGEVITLANPPGDLAARLRHGR